MSDATNSTPSQSTSEGPRHAEGSPPTSTMHSSTPSGSTPGNPAPPTAIEWVPVADLVREAYPVPAEPIQMPQGDGKDAYDPDRIGALADRIRQTGRFDAIHIDEGNKIMDGRRRHAAAVLLGQERVPCLRYTGLSEAQKWEHAWTQGARREFAKLPKQQKQELTRQALLRLHRYSDAYIAGLVPESERTIAERRAAMVEAQEIPEHPRLMGLDGKTYPVKSRAQKAAEAAAERAEQERQRAAFEARREETERQRQEAERRLTPEEKAERAERERNEQEERDAEQLKNFVLDKKEPVVAEVPDGIGPLPPGRYLVRVREGHPGPIIRRFGYSGVIDLYPSPAAAAAPPVEQPPAAEPQDSPPDKAPPAEPQNSPAEPSAAGQKVTPATKQTTRSKAHKK